MKINIQLTFIKNVFHSFHGTGLSLLSMKCIRKSKQVKLVYTTGKLPTNCNCYLSLSNAHGKFISYDLISFILFNTSILFLFWLFLPLWRMHDLLLSYLICFGYCFLCIVVVYTPNVYLIEVKVITVICFSFVNQLLFYKCSIYAFC